MRLKIDKEFEKVKIKDLNEMNNVKMFTTSVRGGKAFAVAQKIRWLKTRISKLNIFPTKIILNSAINMNNVLSAKDLLTPEKIEKKKSFSHKRFRTIFKMPDRKN